VIRYPTHRQYVWEVTQKCNLGHDSIGQIETRPLFEHLTGLLALAQLGRIARAATYKRRFTLGLKLKLPPAETASMHE
jgi:hypothetical protein